MDAFWIEVWDVAQRVGWVSNRIIQELCQVIEQELPDPTKRRLLDKLREEAYAERRRFPNEKCC